MAAHRTLLAGLSHQLARLDRLGLGYLALIITVALTAGFSTKPYRRKAALDVLRILVPGRRQSINRPSRAARRRAPERIERPPDDRSPPPNQSTAMETPSTSQTPS